MCLWRSQDPGTVLEVPKGKPLVAYKRVIIRENGVIVSPCMGTRWPKWGLRLRNPIGPVDGAPSRGIYCYKAARNAGLGYSPSVRLEIWGSVVEHRASRRSACIHSGYRAQNARITKVFLLARDGDRPRREKALALADLVRERYGVEVDS